MRCRKQRMAMMGAAHDCELDRQASLGAEIAIHTAGEDSCRDLLTMPIEASSSASRLSVVLVRAGGLLCALPLASVIETLRSPSIMPIAGTPAWVRGIAVIRGGTVAVVDLGILLGSGAGASKQARVVTVRVGSRIVGLAVDSIVGVSEFERSVLSDVPPMLRQAHPEVLAAMGMLDRELLMVLDGSRIITEQELEGFEASR